MYESDVFVIGGGPAGLAAAIAARRRGFSVIVADGNTPPVDKACGEGLMPDSRRSAERIGIHIPRSIGFEFRGIRFHGEGRMVEADFPNGRGIGLRRTELHDLLIDTAISAGVEVRWGMPVSRMDRVCARWIVGADGTASRVRRQGRARCSGLPIAPFRLSETFRNGALDRFDGDLLGLGLPDLRYPRRGE